MHRGGWRMGTKLDMCVLPCACAQQWWLCQQCLQCNGICTVLLVLGKPAHWVPGTNGIAPASCKSSSGREVRMYAVGVQGSVGHMSGVCSTAAVMSLST
jgi:hypothetical protein